MNNLVVLLDRLVINLKKQFDMFNESSSATRIKNFKQEIEQLIREEGRIIFDIEAPKLEEVRKKVFATVEGVFITEGQSQNIATEQYERFELTNGMEPCQKKDFHVDEIAGTVYAKDFSSLPKKAILVIPGFHASRTLYDVFCKAVANEGYLAYVIDMPAHGDSGGISFDIALTSEWLMKAMKIARGYFGVQEFGLVGHSTGSIAAMYALSGYNRTVEKKLYEVFYEYERFLEQEHSKEDNSVSQSAMVFYEQIIAIIFDSIKQGVINMKNLMYGGKVSFVACIAMPPRFQSQFPPALSRFINRIPKMLHGVLFDLLGNNAAKKASKDEKGISRFKKDKKYNGFELIYLRIPEVRPFMKYLASMKNPIDYMNLLNFFSEESKYTEHLISRLHGGKLNVADKKRGQFIRYFRDKYILGVPKVFMYGTNDAVLQTATNWKTKFALFFKDKSGLTPKQELEGIYQMLSRPDGAEYPILPISGVNHIFTNQGERVNNIAQSLTNEQAFRELMAQIKKNI